MVNAHIHQEKKTKNTVTILAHSSFYTVPFNAHVHMFTFSSLNSEVMQEDADKHLVQVFYFFFFLRNNAFLWKIV